MTTPDGGHLDTQPNWLRFLRSDMLAESSALAALAHVSACPRCRAAYEAAVPFAPGEWEAELRAKAEAAVAARRRAAAAATAPAPRWTTLLVDWLEGARQALTPMQPARAPAMLGGAGGAASEWPKERLLNVDRTTLPSGKEIRWRIYAVERQQDRFGLQVRFSPAAWPAVEGLVCVLESPDLATDGGPRRSPIVRPGNPPGPPQADFVFLVGGQRLRDEIPAVRISLEQP